MYEEFRQPIILQSWYRREQLDSSGQTVLNVQYNVDREVKLAWRSRTHFHLKDWRDKIKRGENATTDFNGLLQYIESDGTGWGQSMRPNGGQWIRAEAHGDILNPGEFANPSSTADTTASNSALQILYKKLRRRRTLWQGAIFTGELKESIGMVRHPAERLREGVRNYFGTINRWLNRSSKRNLEKIIGDTWLEYSFGWTPLVSDIADAVKAYRKLAEKDERLKLSGTAGKETSTVLGESNYSWGWGDMTTVFRHTQKTEMSVRYLVGVREAVLASEVPEYLERAGFVTSQLVPTLWELTPWSFLVDYFTNIGDIVDSYATNTSDVTWGCKTVRNKITNVYDMRMNTALFKQNFPQSKSYLVGDPGSIRYVSKRVIRSPFSQVPLPSLSVEFPRSPNQWANMTALALSRKPILKFFLNQRSNSRR